MRIVLEDTEPALLAVVLAVVLVEMVVEVMVEVLAVVAALAAFFVFFLEPLGGCFGASMMFESSGTPPCKIGSGVVGVNCNKQTQTFTYKFCTHTT